MTRGVIDFVSPGRGSDVTALPCCGRDSQGHVTDCPERPVPGRTSKLTIGDVRRRLLRRLDALTLTLRMAGHTLSPEGRAMLEGRRDEVLIALDWLDEADA